MAIHIEFKASVADDWASHEADASIGLARWLKARLEDSGIDVESPTRHDWGFEILIYAKGGQYYAGFPRRRDASKNWHVFVERRQSIRDRVRGKSMPDDEPMAMLIKEIISLEPQFKIVRVQQHH